MELLAAVAHQVRLNPCVNYIRAVLSEGSGAEAVVPLERNKAWINAVTNEMIEQLKTKGILAGSSSNVSNAKDYNFTQIINAPKQPSRIELYRQTRNLLAYANATGGE